MKFLILIYLLITCNSITVLAQEKSFEKTLKNINTSLERWAEKENVVTVSANLNGSIIITNKQKQTLRFNMFDLLNLNPGTPDEINGIELDYCDRKAHVPLSWINFNTDKGKVAFIRLDCNIPSEELTNIYNDFINLKSFCNRL